MRALVKQKAEPGIWLRDIPEPEPPMPAGGGAPGMGGGMGGMPGGGKIQLP